jgi:hypothetical protein
VIDLAELAKDLDEASAVADVHAGVRRALAAGRTLLAALEEAQRERDELRYERRLLGMARRVLDLAAEGGHLGYDVDYIRNQAADVAQRIVDEIGHPATDEPALGPSFREQLAAARADAERIREERDAARAQTVRMSRALRAAANRDGLVVQHACGAVRAFDRPPASGGCLQCADYIGGWAPLYRLGPAEDPTEPLGFFAAAESQTGGTE